MSDRPAVEIVTHCYCPPGVRHYAEMLRWQFASLVHWPPKSRVRLTVCFTTDDGVTSAMLQRLVGIHADVADRAPHLMAVDLRPQLLFRRAIGRDYVASHSTADVVWFTDVDYLFGEGCIDSVVAAVSPGDGLCHPESILINKDHATGDEMVAANLDVDLPKPDLSLFVPRRQRVAIGGVQIVGGDYARKSGYLPGTKWSHPVDAARGFRSCRCDRAFRRQCGGSRKIKVPGVLRMRHTVDGRDYTIDGRKAGREAW